MEKILKLYTYVDGVNDTPFPSEKHQVVTSDFRSDYKRMGAVPTISCTIMHPLCLDKLWTDNVYAEFKGEKFFIKQTATSSYDNTDSRYKHEVELVSERIILDNVYVFDVVTNDVENDKPVSNSTKFTFFGTIHELAERLNYSLQYSKLDYRVIVDEGVTSEGKLISFENQFFSNALQESYNTYEIPYYFVGKDIHIGFTNNAITKTFKYGVDESLLSIQKNNANAKIVNRITGVGSAENIPYYYPNNDEKGETRLLYNGEVGGVSINNVARYKKVKLGDVFSYKVDEGGTTPLWVLDEYNLSEPYYWGQEIDDFGEVIDGVYLYNVNFSYSFPIDIYTYVNFEVNTYPVGYPYDMELKEFNVQLTEDTRGLIGTYYKSFSEALGQGNYVLQVHAVMRLSYKPEEILLSDFKEIINIGFFINATYYKETEKTWYLNGIKVSLDSYGITITNTPKDGDKITFEQVSYLMPQENLMPTIYRESEGKERFYNALNETYISPQTNDYYQFENPYVDGKPKEHFINFEEIKPTIVGITNAGSQRIDMFSEFAYDEDDNDEKDEEGNYIHPYFFGKLRRFDGDYGFNLFEHAIDEGEMTISMTSGNCGGCEWVIGVDEDTQKNIVQVNEYGNLLRDDNGNVKLGSPQERQNDTSKYEVWVALKKDINTFGVIMPNATNNYKPNTEDTFVILHIDLPKAYILAAEKKLEEELIKYMAINNSEKFNFSISFSRIFFAENPDILEQLNENARIQIEYDNTLYELYVSSYSYNMSNDKPLPEIKVELSDTLTVSQNAIQNAVDSVKHDIMSSVGSIDFLKQGLRYFIRKDVDDRAKGKISTDKAFEVGEYVSGSSGAIIYKDPITGQTIGEMDKLYVRMKAYFETLEIINAQSIGGKQIISPVGSVACVGVEELDNSYRCYFLAEQDGEVVQNRWQVNDQAYSQMFNANIGVTNKVSNHYYWRLVTNVSDSLVEYNEKKCHYIDLSKTDMDKNSDVPKVGDIINQRGSRTDIDRMNFVETSSIDAFSPSVTLYHGVNSFSLVGKDYVQFGVDKTTNKAFMNVYGDMYVGDRNKTAYMRYTQEEGLVICGKLDVGTKLGDSYLKDLISASTPEGYQEFVEKVTQDLEGLQAQIDGTIDSYFFQYEPSLDNYPASEWDTENEKKAHLNDTFTNLVDGRSWRWSLDGTYKWVEITDTATTKALALAGKAKDTADGKRRVFVVTDEHPTPYPPYDKGDLWSRGSDYPLLICVVPKESGVYAEGDFDYADNTEKLREEMTNLVNTTKAELDSSISSTKTAMEGYTDDAKKALQQSIDLLEETKAEVDNVYSIADADAKISAAEADAIKKAEELADAARDLAEKNVQAWADGEISEAEQRAIDEAQARVDAAKSELEEAIEAIDTKYAKLVADTKDELNNSIGQAKEAANKYADEGIASAKEDINASIAELEQAKANVTEVYSKAEADGKITEAEASAINAAKAQADAAIALSETTIKAYADGIVDDEEAARIKQAQENLAEAKKYAEEQAQAAKSEIENSYLFQALQDAQSTEIENGLVLTSLIQLRDTQSNIMSGINGLINASKGDKSIATWWGGDMLDLIDYYRWDGTQWVVKSGLTAPSNIPSGLIRMDGTGYLAKGKFWWDNDGKIYADPTALFLSFDVNAEEGTLSATILDIRDKQTEFANMWSLETDSNGTKYLYSKYPLVSQGGVTMYAGTSGLDVEGIYDGLPIDGSTIYWENGVLKAQGGGGGVADSVAWADITGKPTFATVATSGSYNDLLNKPTLLSSFTNDVGYLTEHQDLSGYQPLITSTNKLAYSLISGTPTIPTSLKSPYALTFGSKTYDGSAAKTITASDLGALTAHQTIYNLTMQAGAFSAVTFDPNGAAKTVNIPTTTSHISEGTNLYFTNARAVSALSSTLSGYLPLSGGTLTDTLILKYAVPRIICYDASGNHLGNIGFYNNTPSVFINNGWQTLLHSGNYSSYALPISGGTLNGSLTIKNSMYPLLTLERTDNTAGIILAFKNSSGVLGSIGMRGTSANASLLRYTTDYNTYYKVWDAGNSNLSSVDWNASKLILNTTDTTDWNVARANNTIQLLKTRSQAGNGPNPYSSGISIMTNYTGFQLATFGGAADLLYFRCIQDNNTWRPWRTVAFTDSDITGNAGSATKLATARTIWGQSFDGTGNVTGVLTINEYVSFNRNNTELGYVGFATNANNNIYISSSGDLLINGIGKTIINNGGGNVGIGTTSPNYKLDVNGSLNATTIYQNGSTLSSILGNYLPLSGGTLSGNLTIGTTTTTANHEIGVYRNADKAVMGVSSDCAYLGLYDSDGSLGMVYVNGSKLQYRKGSTWYDIWHSGNDGSGSGLDADLLDGTDKSGLSSYMLGHYNEKILAENTDLNNVGAGIWGTINNTAYTNSPFSANFGIISMTLNSTYLGQLALPYEPNSNIRYRKQYYANGRVWSDWKTLAFTTDNVASATTASNVTINYLYNQDNDFPLLMTSRDVIGTAISSYVATDFSGKLTYNPKTDTLKCGTFTGNAASATKLQTPRTIWGQSFDGTGNVSGTLYADKYIFMKSGSEGIYIHENGISWHNSSNSFTKEILVFTSSGNVGIGTTSTAYKLDVNGNLRVNSNIYGCLAVRDANGNWIVGKSDSDNGEVSLGSTNKTQAVTLRNSAGSVVLNSGGDVGIGTTSPGYKLDVVGASRSRYMWFFNTSFNGNAGYIGRGSGSNNDIYIHSVGSLRFGVNSTDNKMVLDTSANLLVLGGITMYSDIRKKTKLKDVELSLKDIADAPLIEHYYNSDDKKTTHVGSIAQYWAGLNDWFCKLDNEGYYTMEIQNAALASSISIARELVRYESETDKQIRVLKSRVRELEEEVKRLRA